MRESLFLFSALSSHLVVFWDSPWDPRSNSQLELLDDAPRAWQPTRKLWSNLLYHFSADVLLFCTLQLPPNDKERLSKSSVQKSCCKSRLCLCCCFHVCLCIWSFKEIWLLGRSLGPTCFSFIVVWALDGAQKLSAPLFQVNLWEAE